MKEMQIIESLKQIEYPLDWTRENVCKYTEKIKGVLVCRYALSERENNFLKTTCNLFEFGVQDLINFFKDKSQDECKQRLRTWWDSFLVDIERVVVHHETYFDMPDGVHEVSQTAVEAFAAIDSNLTGVCGHMSTRWKWAHFYAIHHGDMFMIVAANQKGKLFRLEGLKPTTLEHQDISYYSERLPIYGQLIKAIYEPYHDSLLKLSNEVKHLGGDGTIHGCIVDVTDVHHIYLNPFDGTVTPYYAPDTHSRLVYDNLLQMLYDKTPGRYWSLEEILRARLLHSEDKSCVKSLPTRLDKRSFPMLSQSGSISRMGKRYAHKLKEPVWDTSHIYGVSNFFLGLQKTYERGIVVTWNDVILDKFVATVKQGNMFSIIDMKALIE